MDTQVTVLDQTEPEREKLVTKPRIEIDLAEVERLAAQGLNQAEIALNLGISQSTLYDRKRESEDFAEAIARGRASGVQKAAGILEQVMGCSDVRAKLDAAKFYLARRGNWAETQVQEHQGPGGGAIQINITKDDDNL